jgi:anti-sigma regulatory factor (Ser/Thr protein kinase)
VCAPSDGVGDEGPPAGGGTAPWARAPHEPFCHHALLYEGEPRYLESATAFVREGVRRGDQVLVLAGSDRLAALREVLGPVPSAVHLCDVGRRGANPARVLALWRDFVDSLARDDRARGMAEPVSTDGGLVLSAERAIHESLLNLAFAESRPFWLVCPYDVSAVVRSGAALESSHHFLTRDPDAPRASPAYRPVDPGHVFGATAGALPPPAPGAEHVTVGREGMRALRRRVGEWAAELGIGESRAADFALAVHEVAANSVRHGGGVGRVALWHERGTLLCDVADRGHFDSPLAGRVRPSAAGAAGRGLWMANQLCDLVQIRSSTEGTVVRLHISIAEPARPEDVP